MPTTHALETTHAGAERPDRFANPYEVRDRHRPAQHWALATPPAASIVPPMSLPEPDPDAVSRFLYEVGALKRTPRSGWNLLGVRVAESVADHSLRTAVIGWCLARLEGVDAERTATLCLFHDLAEARIGDPHGLARRYVPREAEELARDEATDALPGALAGPLHELHGEYGDGGTHEARLAHDADRLECLLQAREYAALGVAGADVFAHNALARIVSPVARELAERCLEMDPDAWWQEAVAPAVAAPVGAPS